MKGMLKGVLKAMNRHSDMVVINLSGQFLINFPLIGLYVFKFDFAERGMLYAFNLYQMYLMVAYALMIRTVDWMRVVDDV